jgi:MFS transporter, UMF1 family
LDPASPSSWLNRLGLHRRELRAWALYDWANSTFMTTVLLIFPVYFSDVAAAEFPATEATRLYGIATTVSMALVALASPLLGAMADYAAIKKKLLAAFLALGVITTGAMALIGRGDWMLALSLFLLANVGVTSSLVFYESLLPHIASEQEVDRVSTAGYALGYLGSGLLMALHLLWIQKPALFGIPSSEAAIRLAFLTSAIWWAAFSIPLFRRVPEPPPAPRPPGMGGGGLLASSFRQLGTTLRELRRYRETFLFLLAFLVYNDGIGTIIRMAPIYGREIGIERGSLLISLMVVQFVGIPFAFLFGMLAGKIGAKRAILLSLVVYTGISVIGYAMKTAAQFFLLAVLVGMVQGGSQALSRSVFSTLVPKHKSSEFFAFFSVFEKFAGIIGPLVFSAMISATGSSRTAILFIVVFFVAGGALLVFVDIEKGQRAAREAEAQARGPSA